VEVLLRKGLAEIDSMRVTHSVTRNYREFASRELSRRACRVFKQDLSATALPLITDDWARPISKFAADAGAAVVSFHLRSLIHELAVADTVVIGAPMYNFTILRHLKHGSIRWCGWERRSATAKRPQGLLGERRLSSSLPAGAPIERHGEEAFDFQEPYLRHILALSD